MNEWMTQLLAVVNTGDDSNMGMWIGILVVVGVILVGMVIASAVVSKKRNAEESKAVEKKPEDKQ